MAALQEELERIAAAAAALAGPDEEIEGVLATEPAGESRLYLCAFRGPPGRTWLVLDAAGVPVPERARVREAVSIAAMCEVAGEVAGGGDLDELRSQLVALRLTENPPGLEEAEAALAELQRAVGAPPTVASPARLDEVGSATLRLERALGEDGASPFATAMKQAVDVIDELGRDVEAGYRLELV